MNREIKEVEWDYHPDIRDDLALFSYAKHLGYTVKAKDGSWHNSLCFHIRKTAIWPSLCDKTARAGDLANGRWGGYRMYPTLKEALDGEAHED